MLVLKRPKESKQNECGNSGGLLVLNILPLLYILIMVHHTLANYMYMYVCWLCKHIERYTYQYLDDVQETTDVPEMMRCHLVIQNKLGTHPTAHNKSFTCTQSTTSDIGYTLHPRPPLPCTQCEKCTQSRHHEAASN